jgi:predicted transport protein
LQLLGHWIYDANDKYTEIWSLSHDKPAIKIWDVRDDIIERSLFLMRDKSGRMWIEQEIQSVGVNVQPISEQEIDHARKQGGATQSGKLREGSVRLSLKYDRAMRQTVKLYAASKDTNESAVVDNSLKIFVDRVLDERVAVPRRTQDAPNVGNTCNGSYVIGAETRKKMQYLKQTFGVSFSEITRAAISYCMAMEDSDNLLRSVSAELARNQSDERIERASEPLAPNVVKRLDQAIRAIAFRDPALSTSRA